jgi:hypothetical protein
MQNNKRLNARHDCKKTGQLHWSGTLYPAAINNVSFAGTGVHLGEYFCGSPPVVEIGGEGVFFQV